MSNVASRRGPSSGRRSTAGQEPAEVGLEAIGVLRYTQISDADHGVAGELKARVADAVPLERGPRAVGLPSIELSDHSLLAPQAIDLELEERDVDGWNWQPSGATEAEEAPFELRFRLVEWNARLVEEGAQGAGAAQP